MTQEESPTPKGGENERDRGKGAIHEPSDRLTPPPKKGEDKHGTVEKGEIHGPCDQTEATSSKERWTTMGPWRGSPRTL